MTTGRRRLLVEDHSTAPHAMTSGPQGRLGGNAGGLHNSHEHNITLIMIVVILVFMLCNAPARLVQVGNTLQVTQHSTYKHG